VKIGATLRAHLAAQIDEFRDNGRIVFDKDHYQLRRVFDVYVMPKAEDLNSISKQVSQIVNGTHPPHGTILTIRGSVNNMHDSFKSFAIGLILSIVLVFLILMAQFASFVDPFIILLTVPMAVTGALLSLWLTGQSINIFSEIGIIMLIGLITKNGILIVEFANQRKEEGMSVREAALSAAGSRFRPILMTTLAMIFGTLPIALSLGTSSGSRTSLGIVVVGGLLFAGILTLYVIPAVYSFLSRPHRAKAPAPVAQHLNPGFPAQTAGPQI